MSHNKQQGSSTEENRFISGQAYRSLRNMATFQAKKDKSKVSMDLVPCVLHGSYILDCVSYNSFSVSYILVYHVNVPVHGGLRVLQKKLTLECSLLQYINQKAMQ